MFVSEIEERLQAQRPGQWRRLTADELNAQPLASLRAGWRIDLPAGSVLMGGVDHLVVVVNGVFPNAQPRILAPQAGSDYRWPHVESGGLLCLRSTQLAANPGERVLQHLIWAHELLNFDAAQRRREFEREFAAYWDQRSGDRAKRPMVLSLMATGGGSREIVYVNDHLRQRIVVADDKAALMKWLRNGGLNPGDKEILTTWLLRLRRPWTPGEYPEVGRDALKLLPDAAFGRVLIPGKRCPILFETTTSTGPVFAAVMLQGATQKELLRGFRGPERVPVERIAASFGSRQVQRCPVARIDGGWIHGRDHNEQFPTLRARTVAIVGCGALGAALAQLLAQAGVGCLILVDPDDLTPANVSRHILGMRYIGRNKAESVARVLREDFPHLRDATGYPRRFEWLTSRELATLAGADLVISAGIDLDGDASLDAWRRGVTSHPPAHLCTWAEAFAIVGHAVLLYGTDSLMSGFDATEQPAFRLTDWPADGNSMIVEAGCGNVFQPHGAADLGSTVMLAGRLAIDALLGRVPASCRRVWKGDLSAVVEHGGTARADFTQSRVVEEMPWS